MAAAIIFTATRWNIDVGIQSHLRAFVEVDELLVFVRIRSLLVKLVEAVAIVMLSGQRGPRVGMLSAQAKTVARNDHPAHGSVRGVVRVCTS
jgi:hypothetical protein